MSYIKRDPKPRYVCMPFTAFSFPFSVWEGKESDYPYNKLIGVASTRRGAMRLARKAERQSTEPEHREQPTIWRSYEPSGPPDA